MAVLLFLCYGLALTAAYWVARRLAPASLPLTVALTILFWIVNLILPVIYTGMVNLLRVETLVVVGVLLWGGEIALAGRIASLSVVAYGKDDGRLLLLRRAGYVICMLFAVAFIVASASLWFQFGPVIDLDAAWHYFPSMINIVQAGTLNHYNMFIPYFPLAYEMIFAWEMVFTRSFVLVPFFHQVLFAGVLLFAWLILQLLLREQRASTRDLASILLLLLLIGSDASLTLVSGTGKSDILLLVTSLAAIYALLRCWHVGSDIRLLLIAGVACGLMMSSKLTAGTWLLLFALLHLLYAWRARLIITALVRDALAVAFPALILLLPWGVRLLGYDFTSSPQAEFNALGATYTILQRWNAPELVAPALASAYQLVLIFGGGALLFISQVRTLRRYIIIGILGAALLYSGALMQAYSIDSDSHYGIYWAMLVAGIVVLAWSIRLRRDSLRTSAVLVLGSALLLAIIPWSAWIFRFHHLVDGETTVVMYRYSPASAYLYLVMMVAFAAQVLSPNVRQPAQAAPISAHRWWYALVPLILLTMLWQSSLFDMARIRERYGLHPLPAPPTPFYAWLYDNIRDARIYSINAPPLPLYGRDFSNTLLYATEGHTGYYGDQAYRWEEVSRMIDAQRLDYIVVSFNYPHMMQASLAPTPDVLAEIEQMRHHLEVVYEDELVVLFATAHASQAP